MEKKRESIKGRDHTSWGGEKALRQIRGVVQGNYEGGLRAPNTSAGAVKNFKKKPK